MRIDKRSYREAAKWLNQNTASSEVIAVPDRRIAFYAERKGLVYDKNIPMELKYVVVVMKEGDKKPEFGTEVQEKAAWLLDNNKRIKRIVVYTTF